MTDLSVGCPAEIEEKAEAYCLGHLPAEEAERFADHFMVCPACAAIVLEANAYIRAMKAAAARMLRDREI
jgi:anti-sigma factor RsiW